MWLIGDLIILSGFLVLTTFNITWESIVGSGGKAVGSAAPRLILVLIVLSISAKALWKSLLQREPESDPFFKRKHRSLKLIAGGFITGAMILASGYGVTVGRRIARHNRIDGLMAQAKELAPKNTAFRLSLQTILSKETPTMKDFYVRCVALGSLLDEYEPYRQKNLALLNSFSNEARGDPELKQADLMRSIYGKDSQIIAALRTEVVAAKQLIALPSDRQAAYYDRQIRPLEVKIKKLADQETDLLHQAHQ